MNHLSSFGKAFWILILSFGLATFFQSCDELATTENNPSTTIASPQPKNTNTIISEEPDIKALEKIAQSIAIEEFNKNAAEAGAKKAIWTTSPELTLLKFCGEKMEEMHTREIRLESTKGSESVTEVLATVMEDGYMDDSVRGAIFIVRMKKTGTHWKITKAGEVFRCRQNRGHLEYGVEPCK